MTALSAGKRVPEMASAFAQPIAYGSSALLNAATFYTGALIAHDTSTDTLEPFTTDTGLVAVGVWTGETFTAGASGAPETLGNGLKCGIFKFENSAAADLIDNNDAGATCYGVDDQTVALTDGTSSRSAAGKIVSVDSDGGVYVAVNPLV